MPALLGQLAIAGGIERRAILVRGIHPGGKLVCRHRPHVEMHVGKTVSAIVAAFAVERAGHIRAQIELRGHPVHRVDHAAQLRHEEGVQHAARCQGEMDRPARGNDELVDRGDVLGGVDEQPLPIQRHTLNFQRRLAGGERHGGIELMGADPCHAAQQHDGHRRHRPDDQLQPAGIFEIGQVFRPDVRCPEPPGEKQRRQDRRQDDDQHDGHGIDQDRLVGQADGAARVEHGQAAAAQREGREQGESPGAHGRTSDKQGRIVLFRKTEPKTY